MALMLSENPMLSISSASSSTIVVADVMSATPLSIKSTSLPGVATMTCEPFLSCLICESIGAPPYTAVTLNPSMYFPKSLRSSHICRHNSRVGDIMTAWVLFSVSSSLCSSGSPNAAVFPVPVCASAIRSFCLSSELSRRCGMTASCTGIGITNPISSIAFLRVSLTPSSSKFAIKICFAFVFGRQ